MKDELANRGNLDEVRIQIRHTKKLYVFGKEK